MEYIEVEFTLTPKEPWADVLSSALCDIGFDSFVESESGLTAYIPAADYSEDALKEEIQKYDDLFSASFKVNNIKEENWNTEWEKNFQPVIISDLCYIRAPFHEPKGEFKYEIIIEPKMSFGTGHHETTTLMARMVLDNDLSAIKGKTVLDMGCGTGILAILAAQAGAENITAIDIDEWAYENSVENTLRNGVPQIKVELGDAKLLHALKFDTILANINRNILLEDMHVYDRALNTGGNLFISGFYVSDIEILKNKATSLGFTFVGENNLNNWAVMHFKK
jgi:ribosomal protein L11 methyltransferase